jgi:hypothetical protein
LRPYLWGGVAYAQIFVVPNYLFLSPISEQTKMHNLQSEGYNAESPHSEYARMPKRIISAVKRVEFVSDRMSYIILRGRWCGMSVLNVHA